ncbi:MAG: CBS domain-containing protein [Verrucomicrobiota bacterium]
MAEVMGTEMFTLTPETAVSSARRLVLENDIHHMLVLENGTLAGIVCREDLRKADRNALVGDCMTSPVLCVTPDTTLQEAVDIMGANDVDCLPVVTGAFLVGIVTLEALATADLMPGGGADGWVARTCAACGARDGLGDGAQAQRPNTMALCTRCSRLMAANQNC